MIFNYITSQAQKGFIDIVNTNQEDILRALPEKYQKDQIIKINRQKNKIYIVPISTKANGRPSVTEIIYSLD